MVTNSTQYLSFLGGEVSPRLWHRSDMDKYGKWFAKAENVRLHEIGSLENRGGFDYIAQTYNNTSGEPVKTISFQYNNDEAYMIEFSRNYFRVLREGKYISGEDGEPLKFDNPLTITDSQVMKYAQSGDMIFIATGNQPIYQLVRNNPDGTDWEMTQFDVDIYPLDEENTDKYKKINIALPEEDDALKFAAGFTVHNYDDSSYINNVSISVTAPDGGVQDVSLTSYSTNLNGLATAINASALNSYFKLSASVSGSTLYLQPSEEWTEPTYDSITINYDVRKTEESIASLEHKEPLNMCYLPQIDTASEYLYGIKYPAKGSDNEFYSDIEMGALDSVISDLNSKIQAKYPTLTIQKKETSDEDKPKLDLYDSSTNTYVSFKIIKIYEQRQTDTMKYPDAGQVLYNATTNFDFFQDIEIGETFALRSYQDSQSWDVNLMVSSGTSSILTGDGNWRFVTGGNWSGKIDLYYSVDNGTTWTKFRTLSSTIANQPNNENVSGTIESNDLVKFKLQYNITGIQDNDGRYACQVYFGTDYYETNSYYKVVSKTNNQLAVVVCVKNDVGEQSDNYYWRKQACSDSKGWPNCVGFYQNRLFMGQGYMLYASRINDFWDFYEPIEVADDDPIIISLLSYKVNYLQNILTMREFFAFTSGGEFGLASSGALTQSDKYLLPYSYHGSNTCDPILSGNIVLFVDSSENTVRMFQYAYESDSYNADDASVLIQQYLEEKRFIATAQLKNTKELLFLTEDGTIYVFKFFPEQNIYAWYHWKHAKYRITNICVVPRGAEEDLYIICDTENGKSVEILNNDMFMDSRRQLQTETDQKSVKTPFESGDLVVVDDGQRTYVENASEGGLAALKRETASATVGLSYTSTATLLSPAVPLQDQTYTTYHKQRPFKAHFIYRDSYGFKVGVEEEEKMSVTFQPLMQTIDQETALTSGKKSVLIPARYDGSAMVSFVQELPYPMIIENVLLEVDYGGR